MMDKAVYMLIMWRVGMATILIATTYILPSVVRINQFHHKSVTESFSFITTYAIKVPMAISIEEFEDRASANALIM